MYIFVAVVLNIMIAFMTSRLAERRGRSSANWFLYGVLFGLFATATLFILSPLTPQEKPSRIRKIAEKDAPSGSSSDNPFENKEWYYLNDDAQQIGPLSFTSLRQVWNSGELNPTSYVWTEGMIEWQIIADVANMESTLGERALFAHT